MSRLRTLWIVLLNAQAHLGGGSRLLHRLHVGLQPLPALDGIENGVADHLVALCIRMVSVGAQAHAAELRDRRIAPRSQIGLMKREDPRMIVLEARPFAFSGPVGEQVYERRGSIEV